MGYLDIHLIQTMPPSVINRDDTGGPKTVTIGGTLRQRLSSQSQKSAARNAMPSVDGIRSRRHITLIADRAHQLDATLDRSELLQAASDALLTAVGDKGVIPENSEWDFPTRTKVAVHLAGGQVDGFARLVADTVRAGDDTVSKKAATAALNTGTSTDIALFGRTMLNAASAQVEAAASVGHAFSVHAVTHDYDFFVTRDDLAGCSSASSMLGTVPFMQSTLYRYASLDMGQLTQNLGDSQAAVATAVEFLKAFTLTLPTSRGHSFAHRTVPDTVMAVCRDDQPLSLAAAFEQAQPLGGTPTAATATDALMNQQRAYDSFLESPGSVHLASTLPSIEEATTLPELLAAVTTDLGGQQ